VFLAPALIAITAILIVPLIYCLRNSLYTYNLEKMYEGQRLVGLCNYLHALHDHYFAGALTVSSLIAVCAVPAELIIGFSLALLLNRPLERRSPSMKKIFRTLAILPVVLPPVVVGLMWRFMFQFTGLVNYVLSLARLAPVDWTKPSTGIATIIVTTVWQNIPFSLLLLLAGLQTIPPDLIDSTMVDGASGWQRVRHLYVPLLMPVIFIILAIRSVDAVRFFDEAYVLTGGGPGRSTETISLFIYRDSFSFFDIGYGSALSMLLFAFLMIITGLYIRAIYGRGEGL